MNAPLQGLKVVEIGQYVAGPMATMLLADLGADVVKVEPPGRGDAFRSYGITHEGVSSFWINVNRGKRSIALDLKAPSDVERCRELVSKADAVVVTSRPGALDNVGLDDRTLESLREGLVRVYVTGYGPSGSRAGEPVFDNLVQGLSGLAVFQGGSESPDVVAPMVVDKTTALLVSHALLAAVFKRHASGEGSRVEVSLLDSVAYWNF